MTPRDQALLWPDLEPPHILSPLFSSHYYLSLPAPPLASPESVIVKLLLRDHLGPNLPPCQEPASPGMICLDSFSGRELPPCGPALGLRAQYIGNKRW